jgi:hypothetical protein
VADKDQYELFRGLYHDEDRTSVQLEGRAKVYLSVITAFVVAMVLKADEVSKSITTLQIPWWAVLVLAVILTASLVCVVAALRIRKYEAVNDGVDIIEGYGGNLPSDVEFFEDRMVDYAVASSRNRIVNNETATVLQVAGWLLVIGMIFVLVLIIYALKGSL